MVCRGYQIVRAFRTYRHREPITSYYLVEVARNSSQIWIVGGEDVQGRLMFLTELAVAYLRRWQVVPDPNRRQCMHG
jgi:hypothetical protein